MKIGNLEIEFIQAKVICQERVKQLVSYMNLVSHRYTPTPCDICV